MKDMQTLREVWEFVSKRRLYWLGLVVLALLTVGLLILATPAPLTPFVYTLF